MRWLPRMFASLRHRNYRLYFFGQFVSLAGMWMQSAAESWLVYEMTGSKALLGAVATAGTLPTLLVSLYGGVLADRLPKRRLLLITQGIMAVLAIILALLVMFDVVEVWHLIALAAVGGLVAGIEMPSRQAFVVDMVGRGDLMNAIGLNSAVFHATRIIGPALAGLAIAAWGTAPCFLANGLTYGAIIMALLAMRLAPHQMVAEQKSAWHGTVEGFMVVLQTPGVLGLMILTFLVGVFGWFYVVMMPAVAKDVLGVGAQGYGVLMSAGGIGSVIGSLAVAGVSRVRDGRIVIGLSMLTFFAAATALSLTTDYHLALLFIAPTGLGMTAFFSSSNTLIQAVVPNAVLGRVMGVYGIVWGAMMPLGSFLAGILAESIGVGMTIRIGAICVGIGGIAALAILPKGLAR